MHIIHIATELAPIAKAGGLGDVVYGLSKELTRIGHTVEVILPKYQCLNEAQLEKLKIEFNQFNIPNTPYFNNTIWNANFHNIQLTLIDPAHSYEFFNQDNIYGYPNDIIRFTYFAKAAIEYLFQTGKPLDILHVHDWPTAFALFLYKTQYAPLGYHIKNTLLTIHNLEHQGRTTRNQLTPIGLTKKDLLSMKDPRDPTLINLLQSGINSADQITTVSCQYQREIQTPHGGFGLDSLLIQRKKHLTGILNGIDETFWNPATDSYLTYKYSTYYIQTPHQFSLVLKGKQANARHLREQLNLQDSKGPLIACVTRLVPQKGPTLIRQALYRTLEKGGQFILLGSSPIPELHQEFQQLQQELAMHPDARIVMDTDEALAHLFFAAADMFIIPSLFEPCGLTQMISQRYGTVPIARLTGGLTDTVFDFETAAIPFEKRNGFTFDHPDFEGVNWALDRAIACYQHNPTTWHKLMKNGMNKDFSWKKSAQEYIDLYIQTP